MKDLNNQIKDDYSIEGNRIVFEYDEELDANYSFNSTIDSLIKEHFYCER